MADGFQAHLVPAALVEDFPAGLGEGLSIAAADAGVEPVAACLLVDAGAPPTVPGGFGVDFDLIAVDAIGGHFDFRALPFEFGGLRETLAADLHAGVQLGIHLEFVFEDEVAVVAGRAEEGVRGVEGGGADDAAVLDRVGGLAAALDPAVEVLAVEEGCPGFCCECGAAGGGAENPCMQVAQGFV